MKKISASDQVRKLLENIDALTEAPKLGPKVYLEYAEATNPSFWEGKPGIEQDDDGMFTITALTKEIVDAIDAHKLKLDIEFISRADIKKMIKSGISVIDDVNRGVIDLDDWIYNR